MPSYQQLPQQEPEADACSYTVQPGDTLWDIASQTRGGGQNWPGLYRQNHSVVGENPNLIFPGQQLNVCAPQATPGVQGPQPLADDDYAGQIDRVKAEQELAGQFQVVPDDFVGPRLPNQVTQAEFQDIAATYSDIRRGQTNFQFDTAGMTDKEAAAFQGHVMGDMSRILTTQSGRDLLNQLAYGKNANGDAVTTTLHNIANPTGANTTDGAGGLSAPIGNGVGTDQIVNYTAGQDVDLGATIPDYESAQYRQFSSDTVLFHELTHAMHIQQGAVPIQTDASGNLTSIDEVGGAQATIPKDSSVFQEEYNTVGLGNAAHDPITENAYRAERGLVTGTPIPQRTDYTGPGPLPVTPATTP